MPKLKIDTQKSLFEPIEIEIDGKIFNVGKLTRPLLLKVEELMREIQTGSFEAGYKVIELLLGEECSDVVSGLDIIHVNKIARFITDSISSAGEDEKNVEKPGDKPSP